MAQPRLQPNKSGKHRVVPSPRRIQVLPVPARTVQRNNFRDIEPTIRSVVRLVLRHSYPATVPVWSCGGHADGEWRKSGEFGRIARGRPYIVLGAAKWIDLLGTALILFEKRRGPMSFLRLIPKGTMLPRLWHVAPTAKRWAMVVFESREAARAAWPSWVVHRGKTRSYAIRLRRKEVHALGT